jgi:uncharacterized protein involved in exopolysaccharide biosynthesis
MKRKSDILPQSVSTAMNGNDLRMTRDAATKDITLLTALTAGTEFVSRHRKPLYRGVAIFVVMGILIAFLIPPTYTARATILPPETGSNNFSRLLAALPMAAAQMLSPAGESKMVDLYVDIAKSQSILSGVLDANDAGMTFREKLRSSATTPDWKLIERTRKSLSGSKHPRTQLVMLELNNHDPELAAALLNEILHQMDSFLRYRVATNENVQRRLIESRLKEVADSLRLTEDMLRQFREGNRATMLSPKLMLEESRLVREVEINNALYIELTKQLELARISEAESMPLLNVLDYPAVPPRKSGPSRLFITLGVMVFGLCVTVTYVTCYKAIPRRARRLADRLLQGRYMADA